MAKSAVDPKYCLLVVDLFTSKVYVYPMKNRTLLAKKLEIFCNDIKSKRSGQMRLQTDLEFNQNKIKELDKNLMYICFIQDFMVEKHLQQNKKLGS